MRKRTPAPNPRVAEGLREIAAWEQWFRAAHELRLSRPHEFPDRHLVDQERATIDGLATAFAAKMREQFLARMPKP